MDLVSAGRLIVLAGLVLVVIGGVLLFTGKIPILARFPFALLFQREGFSLFIPIAAMVVISVVLTVVLNLVARWSR